MKTYNKEKTTWRTCDNCVHSYVCKFRKDNKDPKTCANHIYNADPNNYGDLQELIIPICEWIRKHYPSEGKLIIDKYSAIFEIPIHSVFYFEDSPISPNKKE